MECICCCSNKIIYEPSGLEGYYRCLSCKFVFTVVKDTGRLREGLVHHYEKVDPHERIAESKESFFSSAIDYISYHHGTSGKMILDIGCGPRGSLEWADNTRYRLWLWLFPRAGRKKRMADLRSGNCPWRRTSCQGKIRRWKYISRDLKASKISS